MLQRLRDVSLRVQLLVLISLAVGGVFIAFLYTSTQALHASTESALQERLVLARLMADRMDFHLDSATRLLQGALSSVRLNLGDNNLEPEKDLLLSMYKESDLFQRVTLLDSAGVLLWLEPYEEGRVGNNLTQPPYSSDFLGVQRPVVIPKPSWRTQAASIAIFVPIPGAGGIPIGYLNAWIDLSNPRAQSLFYPYEPGSAGYTDLVDATGAVLASTRADRSNQVTDHAGTFANLIASNQATVGRCHTCHAGENTIQQRDVLAFAPLASVEWGIALRQPESEVLASTESLSGRLSTLALVVLAAFVGLLWISTQQFVHPLGVLTRACQRIAGGDLSQPVPITGTGETANLARSFEGMRQHLLGYEEQMRQHQYDLERRIRERTIELVESRDDLIRTNRNLTTLNRVAAILSQSLDPKETISATLDCALDAVSAERGGIVLQGHKGKLTLAAQRGLGSDVVEVLNNRSCRMANDTEHSLEAEPPCRQFLASHLGVPSLLCTPLLAEGEGLGCLLVADSRPDHFSAEDQRLLAAISSQVAVTVHNIRLYEVLQWEEQARGKLVRQVIGAQEDERKRIARELHDETSQSLTALMVGLDSVRMALAAGNGSAETHLTSTRTIALGMLSNIHRLVADLRPSLLDDLGLVPAITAYCEMRLKPLGIRMYMTGNLLEQRLPASVEVPLFRIVQEAVTNIIRHAHASEMTLDLQQTDGHIVLTVGDNGRGFKAAEGLGTPDSQGVGLLGMQERAVMLGGDCQIRSAEGQGTEITVTIPYRSPTGDAGAARSSPED